MKSDSDSGSVIVSFQLKEKFHVGIGTLTNGLQNMIGTPLRKLEKGIGTLKKRLEKRMGELHRTGQAPGHAGFLAFGSDVHSLSFSKYPSGCASFSKYYKIS